MNEQFTRTQSLLGSAAMEKLAHSRVAVFGLGGVGGYAVEALARSGLGAMDIIDNDTVALSNLNRQVIATLTVIGQYKVDVCEKRIRAINPEIKITKHKTFFTPETADGFDFSQFDYVIDAIDTVTGKIELVMRSNAAGVPIISSMGTGNKLDPTRLEVADIYKTSVCPLARVMRTELRRRGVKRLKVVYSKEPPIAPDSAEIPENSRRAVPGSVAFVPSVAGLIIAGEVIRDLVGRSR